MCFSAAHYLIVLTIVVVPVDVAAEPRLLAVLRGLVVLLTAFEQPVLSLLRMHRIASVAQLLRSPATMPAFELFDNLVVRASAVLALGVCYGTLLAPALCWILGHATPLAG